MKGNIEGKIQNWKSFNESKQSDSETITIFQELATKGTIGKRREKRRTLNNIFFKKELNIMKNTIKSEGIRNLKN